MKYDTENGRLELEIRTRGYRITLDVPNRTVMVARNDESDWRISLRCKDGGCVAC